MTNAEILMGECAVRGITEEVHTFARWKSMGYVVKKGQKALFDTQLWKMSNKKVVEKDNADGDPNDENKHNKQRMYLCKSFLFGRSQVEEIKEDK